MVDTTHTNNPAPNGDVIAKPVILRVPRRGGVRTREVPLKLNSAELLEVFWEFSNTRKHKKVIAADKGITVATLDGYLVNQDAIMAVIQSQT